MTDSVYDAAFFDWLSADSQQSVSLVLPIVRDLLNPSSVVDIGCGVGTWLAGWRNLGIEDVLGIDGDYVDRSHLEIPSDQFLAADLERPLRVGRQFDLVQSLEVAEHLSEQHAQQFVETLACHGDRILFSAAIPGQGGVDHVNEQWPSYWIEKFSRLGFRAYDVLRPRIWSDDRISFWYRQNILIFARTMPFDPPETSIDVVHPERWNLALTPAPPPPPTLRFLLTNLVPAAMRGLTYYMRRR